MSGHPALPAKPYCLLGLCLFALAGGPDIRAETVLALTANADLVRLGPQGQLLTDQAIRTPVAANLLRGICLSDMDPDHEGKELLVIRDDNHVETYPSPLGEGAALARLAFHHLSGTADGDLMAYTIQGDAKTPFQSLVTLAETPKGDLRLRTYAFSSSSGLHLPCISESVLAPSADLKNPALASLDQTSPAILLADKAGHYELVRPSTETSTPQRIKSRFDLLPGDSLQAVAVRGDRLCAITTRHMLLSQTLADDGPPRETERHRLTTAYDIVALFIDDTPPPPFDRRQVAWSPPDASGYRYADVAALMADRFPAETQPPPLLLASATTPGSRATRIDLPATDKPATVRIPMNIALPDDTQAIALWLKSAHPGDCTARFVLADDNGSFVLTEGNPEGVPPTPPQWGLRYSTEARFNDWTLRQAYLTGKHRRLSLLHIEISQSKAADTLAICGPRIIDKATPRAESSLVWKLKDFVLPKQNSLNWTATYYYEYGYDRPAVLPRSAWLQSLYGRDKASADGLQPPPRLDILVRAADGKPLKFWTLDRAELSEPIALPRLPEGSWFLDLSARDANDAVTAQARVVYQVLRDDSGGETAVSAPSVPPFMIAGIVHDGASATVGSPLEARLQVNPPRGWSDWPLTADWEVQTTDGLSVSTGTATITRDALDAPLPLPSEQAGAYIVTAKLSDATGKPLDRTRETYGVASPKTAMTPPGDFKRTPLDYGAVTSISLASTHYDPEQIQRLPTNTFPELNRWSKTAGMACGILQKWDGTVEPMQGCYQWRFFDAELSKVRDMGIASAWTGVGYTGDSLPEWLWFEELMDQHQQTIQAEYHYVSPFGPRFRTARNQLNAELLTHYRDNPGLAGVMLYCGPSEGYLTDTGPMISGYSPAARDAFRTYLKNRYGSDLGKLNRTWDASFRTWDEVAPPRPDWSRSWESSPAWWDFHSFKADWILHDIGGFFARSRALAPDLPMMSYGKEGFGCTGRLAPIFRQSQIRYTNGGGETLASYIQTSIMRAHGVPANPEGHYVMPNIGSVSMVIANSLFAGQYQGQNIMWGMVWTKTPHVGVAEYQAVARLTSAIDRHAQEMNATRPLQPWAAYFGSTRAMLESRSFRNPPNKEADLIAAVSGRQLHNLCSWVDDGSELSAMRRYPLIVDSGAHVIAPESLPVLLDYVAGGGTFVATTDTARYLAGNPREANALLHDHLSAAVIARAVQSGAISSSDQGLTLSRQDKIDWHDHLPHKPQALLSTTDGRPLVWEVPYGRGRFLILCGSPDWAKSAPWLQNLINVTAGPQPYSIEGKNLVARPLRGPDADYLVFVAMMPDQGLNHTDKTLESAPKTRVTVKGLPTELSSAEELITQAIHMSSGGTLDLETTPGMVRIIKIPRTPGKSAVVTKAHGTTR